VRASKSVVVMNGHILARVPPAFGGHNFLMEQMPPTRSWGTRFVNEPLAKRRSGGCLRFPAFTNTIALWPGVGVEFRVPASNANTGIAFTDACGEAAFAFAASDSGGDFIFAGVETW